MQTNEQLSVFDRFSSLRSSEDKMSRAELKEQLVQLRSEMQENKEKTESSGVGEMDSAEKNDLHSKKKQLEALKNELLNLKESQECNDSNEGEDDSVDSIGQKVLSLHR